MDNHGLQCGFCTPGFLMLITGVLEREPDISDEELIDVLSSNLCRCTGYQNIVKAVRAAAGEMRQQRIGLNGTLKPQANGVGTVKSKTKHVGQSLTAPGRPAASDRARPLCRRYFVSAAIAHAHRAIELSPTANCAAIDAAAALALPGVHAVWTAADVADIPPIDFRLSRIEGLEHYRQRLFADGYVRYVGEPVAAVFADDPYLAEDAAELVELDIEELPAVLHADAPTRRIRAGPLDRNRRRAQGLWRRSTRLSQHAHADRRANAVGRTPFRRAAGNPRRHRPLRRRARRARNARRRQGAALESRPDRPNARAQSLFRASVRRPCRRRLRHSRRDLSGGRAGVRRGAAHATADQMDRGSPRASDRRQSFAPAAASHSRRGRSRRAHPRDRRRDFLRSGRLYAHPRRRPCPISPPRCCRARIESRPIGSLRMCA